MKFLVEKLFGFLGSLLSTCSSDIPLLRGRGIFPSSVLFLCIENVCVKVTTVVQLLCLSRIYSEKEKGQATSISNCHSQ